VALWAFGSAAWAQGAAPAAAQANPGYTTAEYNAYNAAKNTANPQDKIRALDAFIAQYNNPTLMPFVYRDLYQTYYGLRDFPKTIEYIDKFLGLGDKLTPVDRLAALINRGQAYVAGSADAALQSPEMLARTRETSDQGLAAVAALPKPANATDEQFNTQKKNISFMFRSVSGIAASQQREWRAAQEAFKAALVLNPEDNTTHYRLGVAYLMDTPPQANDGFWELGRSIALRIQGAEQVRAYLRGRLMQYQQPACEKLADDQITQLITLATASAERPYDFNVPSAQDLQTARDDTSNFLPWLQEGGQHGQIMWLATCGLEYPDVTVRVMQVVPGEVGNVTLKVFRAPTQEAMEAATEPNMEVHVVGQPEASRLSKDDYIRFTGTVTGYQPTPFLLTWDDAKVNPEDIPEAAAPGRRGAAPARPGA
jgi:tetratricopeptide (TPR) repeat protein